MLSASHGAPRTERTDSHPRLVVLLCGGAVRTPLISKEIPRALYMSALGLDPGFSSGLFTGTAPVPTPAGTLDASGSPVCWSGDAWPHPLRQLSASTLLGRRPPGPGPRPPSAEGRPVLRSCSSSLLKAREGSASGEWLAAPRNRLWEPCPTRGCAGCL